VNANVALAAGAFLGVLILLLVVVAIGFQVAYGERIYPGVRALGVNVGGRTMAEARLLLEQRAMEMANRSLVIGFQELRWTVTGLHMGVRPEVDPVVEEAYKLGRQGNPISRYFSQLGLFFNGGAHEVTAPSYDAAAFNHFMDALAGAVQRPVSDASLAITPEGTVQFDEGLAGRRLASDVTRKRLEEALAQPDVAFVELAVEESPPQVRTEDLANARAQAERLLSGPILLKFQEAEWQLTPKELASMADLNGGRDVQLNREAIKSWAAKLAKEVDQDPENARFSWTSGNLALLRPSKDGRDLDVEKTTEIIAAKAFEQDRAVVLPVNVTKPTVSQEDGPKLAIQGAIEVAKTSFAGASPPKQHNINLAAKNLNGVVIPPNQLFSFNKEVGSTSLDAGYKLGWGIANAGTNVKTVPSVAGGICQVSTTLFHAVFFAGYQIEERNYHLYWIPSYTTRGVEGLDATVDEEAKLDFRFYNNTEDYLLIQSWTEGSSVVFGLYGTKPDWTVKVTPGERTDVIDASTDKITEEEPSLPAGQRLAVEGAMDGFKVVNVREVKRGSEVRPLRLASTYRPSRNVTLVG
jgi:vancomycin resistance protein YoaR